MIEYAVINDYGDNWEDGIIVFSSKDLDEVYNWAESENYHSASIVKIVDNKRMKKL